MSVLLQSWNLDTLLGPMLAISDEEALYFLAFSDQKGIPREIDQLQKRTKSVVVSEKTKPILSIERELTEYFNGELHTFETPVHLFGSPFQKSVWDTLIPIPYGETRSYSDQARAIGKPSACRAVAGANAANRISILIPCHRIINQSGALGGYAGGIQRKKWLLQHEEQYKGAK